MYMYLIIGTARTAGKISEAQTIDFGYRADPVVGSAYVPRKSELLDARIG
jgi:hypothetical protein